MKTTKKSHERQIQNFKQKLALQEQELVPKEENTSTLAVSDEKDIEGAFSTVIQGKRRASLPTEEPKKKKKREKDSEHYIPHTAPDRHTEEG